MRFTYYLSRSVCTEYWSEQIFSSKSASLATLTSAHWLLLGNPWLRDPSMLPRRWSRSVACYPYWRNYVAIVARTSGNNTCDFCSSLRQVCFWFFAPSSGFAMSVIAMLSAVASFIKLPSYAEKVDIDGYVFKAHYKVTTALLIGCSILVSANHLFGTISSLSTWKLARRGRAILGWYCAINYVKHFTLFRGGVSAPLHNKGQYIHIYILTPLIEGG